MKFLILLMILFSSNVYSAYDYEYENNWYVDYKDSNNFHHFFSFQGYRNDRIPDTDCTLGQVIHKEDPNMKDDIFSRTISCLEMDINETFSCNFDSNWKDESGESDEYATTCRKTYKNLTIVLKIRRYPNTKYWNKSEMQKAIKTAVPSLIIKK